MQTNEFYLTLLEDIVTTLKMRKSLSRKRPTSNIGWLINLYGRLADVSIDVTEELSSSLIRGRLIALLALIFDWIEWLEDKDNPQ